MRTPSQPFGEKEYALREDDDASSRARDIERDETAYARSGSGIMSGSTRYLRYIVFAFVALVVIFFISSSSSQVPGHEAAKGMLAKGQGWTGSAPAGTGEKVGSSLEKETDALPLGTARQTVDSKAAAVPAHTQAPSKQDTSPNPYASSPAGSHLTSSTNAGPRMNATFVTLARNSDIWEISRSIRQVEDRFNHAFNYDWVFLNDAEFDDTFKKVTSALTSGKTFYGKIGSEHWGYPSWIDQDRAKKVRDDMREKKIIYGDSVSYRHMCRYESGFFFHHPLMLNYEWYWRVEPSIELYCDIPYDPFKFMADNKKKYSFVLSLYEYVETIPTLWDSVTKFMAKHPEHVAKDNSMAFLSNDGGKTYNHCHFWSNFEIGSLLWLRGQGYTDYFNSLDRDGGFFYERWGDAPVHSIAAALMLPKDEIHWFEDIAYYHVPFTHCPTGEQKRIDGKCHCNPKDNFDWNGYSCTEKYLTVNGRNEDGRSLGAAASGDPELGWWKSSNRVDVLAGSEDEEDMGSEDE